MTTRKIKTRINPQKYTTMNENVTLKEDTIINQIYLIRGVKVMLDSDLAELYGIDTRVLNQAVKRNLKRFPDDFMFTLTETEFQNLKSQIVTSSWGGRRKLPFVFTEQGVAMLSSVLNSDTAIEVNIQIIRVFTKMREMLTNHKDFLLKIEMLENNILKQNTQIQQNTDDIQLVFDALKALLKTDPEPRKRIGFKPD
jgi:hypothetical protein